MSPDEITLDAIGIFVFAVLGAGIVQAACEVPVTLAVLVVAGVGILAANQVGIDPEEY